MRLKLVRARSLLDTVRYPRLIATASARRAGQWTFHSSWVPAAFGDCEQPRRLLSQPVSRAPCTAKAGMPLKSQAV